MAIVAAAWQQRFSETRNKQWRHQRGVCCAARVEHIIDSEGGNESESVINSISEKRSEMK